ncbi:MAG: hypothetical protein WD734_02120 [Dehalococcoidia bacterium]
MVSRLEGWGVRRRATALAAVIAMLVASAWVWPTVDAYGRAGALFAEAVLARPLPWAGPTVEEEVRWPEGGVGLLTRPAADEQYPALLLVLGAEPAAPDDPRVQRLLRALARAGFAVLLADPEPLIDGRVTPDEVPLLVEGFQALRAHPAVRPDRVGFLGLSVGGSTQLVAAADPAIAEDVWMVFAIGPYFDAATLTAEVLGGAYRHDGDLVPWEPDETSVRVTTNTLLAALPADEVEALREDSRPATSDGRLVRDLLEADSYDAVIALISRLDGDLRSRLAAVSPAEHLDGLRAPLYLLHDMDDPFIPPTHSDALADRYSPRAYHRIELFQHVEPRPSDAGILLRDGWRMLQMFAEVIREGRD